MKSRAFISGILAFVVLLCVVVFSFGEEDLSASPAETVTFKKLTVPVDSEDIDLGKIKVEKKEFEDFYDFLSLLPDLKHVDMFSTHITAPYIEELIRRFPQVTFGWTMEISVHKHLVRTDAVTFSTRHYDYDKRHTEEDFALLKYCPDLLALDIGHNEVHDLSFLYALPKLRVLILADDRIDCDITPVGSLHDLIYLELYKNRITDISPLVSLVNLHYLNLNFNLVEDLTPLKSLQKLDDLWMAYSTSSRIPEPVDPQVVKEITAALPNTVINSDARSYDGGGWLRIPDVQRVKRMFGERVYIPLDCERNAE